MFYESQRKLSGSNRSALLTIIFLLPIPSRREPRATPRACGLGRMCLHAQSLSHVWLFATPMDSSPPGSSVRLQFLQVAGHKSSPNPCSVQFSCSVVSDSLQPKCYYNIQDLDAFTLTLGCFFHQFLYLNCALAWTWRAVPRQINLVFQCN